MLNVLSITFICSQYFLSMYSISVHQLKYSQLKLRLFVLSFSSIISALSQHSASVLSAYSVLRIESHIHISVALKFQTSFIKMCSVSIGLADPTFSR